MAVEMSEFARRIMRDKYSHEKEDGEQESWEEIAERVTKNVMRAVRAPKALRDKIERAIVERRFMPGGRYLANAGRPVHMTQNCFCMLAEDSREGWAELLRNSTQALMLGGGIGVVYSKIRPEGKSVRKTGGVATGPLPLMQAVNEVGRAIVNGGNRRCAIWAGLNWAHADIHKFITYKNWLPEVRALKEKDFSFPATLDMTNISVMLDEEFFTAYHDERDPRHAMAQSVYWATVKQMLKTSEPGFSIDIGKNKREILKNACTEFCSEDDSDVCNLGSINLARVMTLAEMADLVEISTAFLLAGTVYSDVPYPKVDLVRTKNRRLGLGLMGLHEWLLLRGKPYGPDPDLERYLEVYAQSGTYARKWAKEWDLSVPVKTRAIAPVGTIGIVGETTTGIEPIFCAAFKQRYWKGEFWAEEHVLDPTAKRLIDMGRLQPEQVEDAYSLARDVERRVAFQAWVQQFVDHAISSTINLPAWGSELNNENTVRDFGNMLMRYLPRLRGVTVYPDKARGGQPLVPVTWAEATEKVGQVTVASVDLCDVTKGGSCGA